MKNGDWCKVSGFMDLLTAIFANVIPDTVLAETGLRLAMPEERS